MCVPLEQILSNENETNSDKLLNQTSCKYVRRAICLVLIINFRCQQGH